MVPMPMLDQTLETPAPTLTGAAAAAGAAAPAAAPSGEDVERLRAELERLQKQQRELMELLGTTRPDKILHDVRNLLQERIFLEAACRQMEP